MKFDVANFELEYSGPKLPNSDRFESTTNTIRWPYCRIK